MAWRWSQRRGELYKADGELVGTGYSGHQDGVNNPDLQDRPFVGPIPRGTWKITAPRDIDGRGPYCLPLFPYATTNDCGRDGFLIHGDSIEHPGARLASEGCIILARAVREMVWNSGDHDLEVIA